MWAATNYKVEEDHIFLTVTGEYSFEQFKGALKVLLEECDKHKMYNVIVDATGISNFTKGLNRFFMGEEMAAKLGNKIRLAVILKPEEVDGHFAETVAVNRGARVKVVTSIDDAREWIRSKRH